jgi:hypothetical protein
MEPTGTIHRNGTQARESFASAMKHGSKHASRTPSRPLSPSYPRSPHFLHGQPLRAQLWITFPCYPKSGVDEHREAPSTVQGNFPECNRIYDA